MVFGVEAQTYNAYNNIEDKVADAVENVNARLRAADINREFYIDHFAPVYDKSTPTACKAILSLNSGNGYLPGE